MMATRVRRLAALTLLVVSLMGLGWGIWPHPPETQRLEIPAADLLPEGSPAVERLSRTLTVAWPAVVRTGDIPVVRLDLAAAAGPPAPPPAEVLAEARLELPGIDFDPPGEASQALLPDRPVRFRWELHAAQPGVYPGTLWLHLRFRPDGSAAESRRVLLAQRLEVRAGAFLGLSGPWARALGAAGALIGAVFGLDGVAAEVWRKATNRRQGT